LLHENATVEENEESISSIKGSVRVGAAFFNACFKRGFLTSGDRVGTEREFIYSKQRG
jgi:hypothetical protein